MPFCGLGVFCHGITGSTINQYPLSTHFKRPRGRPCGLPGFSNGKQRRSQLRLASNRQFVCLLHVQFPRAHEYPTRQRGHILCRCHGREGFDAILQCHPQRSSNRRAAALLNQSHPGARRGRRPALERRDRQHPLPGPIHHQRNLYEHPSGSRRGPRPALRHEQCEQRRVARWQFIAADRGRQCVSGK